MSSLMAGGGGGGGGSGSGVVAAPSAAELRRERILRNGQKRLDLLIGVKNSENDLASNAKLIGDASILSNVLAQEKGDSIASASRKSSLINSDIAPANKTKNPLIQQQQTSSSPTIPSSFNHLSHKPNLTSVTNSNQIITTEIKTNINNDSNISVIKESLTKCSFNGYSNKEIFIFFLIALCTSLSFVFEVSSYIYQVGCFIFLVKIAAETFQRISF